MEDRDKRHRELLRLIQAEGFSSQQKICLAMRRKGFAVTQPSISRDMRDLGVLKVGGRYLLPKEGAIGEIAKQAKRRLLLGIDVAGPNLIVVRTEEGAANIVALEIEKLELDGLVGTVAGDDTIFLAVRDAGKQKGILSRLKTA